MGHCERYATGLLVQGCTSPPPASSFRVAGLLSRVPVLAAYDTAPNRAKGRAEVVYGHDQGTYRGYAGLEGIGLESALMHRHTSFMVSAQKPQIGSKRSGASIFVDKHRKRAAILQPKGALMQHACCHR